MPEKKEKTAPVIDDQDEKAETTQLTDEKLDTVTGGHDKSFINTQVQGDPDFLNTGANSEGTFSLEGKFPLKVSLRDILPLPAKLSTDLPTPKQTEGFNP